MSKTPPPKRDPMTIVYAAFIALIVVIVAGFAIWKWNDNRLTALAHDEAYATPTPGPDAKQKGIQLTDGNEFTKPPTPPSAPGAAVFPKGDTAEGGNGSPVDGIECAGMEFPQMHIHAHLSLFDHGKQVRVPALVGASQTGNCLYWLHTHNETGVIHIEAPQYEAPKGGPYTLGIFFDIWGQPLNTNQVATFKGPVTAFVNGAKYAGNPGDIPLRSHEDITLEVGTPVIDPPPHYLLPPND